MREDSTPHLGPARAFVMVTSTTFDLAALKQADSESKRGGLLYVSVVTAALAVQLVSLGWATLWSYFRGELSTGVGEVDLLLLPASERLSGSDSLPSVDFCRARPGLRWTDGGYISRTEPTSAKTSSGAAGDSSCATIGSYPRWSRALGPSRYGVPISGVAVPCSPKRRSRPSCGSLGRATLP